MPKPRILVADDHALVLEGFRRILEERYELVGMAGDGYELLAAAKTVQPDIVILDISMPLLNGLPFLPRSSGPGILADHRELSKANL